MRKVLLASMGLILAGLIGCETAPKEATPEPKPEPEKEAPVKPRGEVKVIKTDVKVGTGDVAELGDTLVVLYRGNLKTGLEFDSNMAPDKKPFNFVLGSGMVIAGWDQGLVGMKVGGERKLDIPYPLAYGNEVNGVIPARSDLLFDIKLLYVVKAAHPGDYDAKDLKPGTGPEVKKGDKVKVHYVGKFLNGLKFDSSRDRGQPFEVTVGAGQVIKGWDDGLIGMKKGGLRRLVLPPALAYGEQGNSSIPPNSVLDFEIELVEIVK